MVDIQLPGRHELDPASNDGPTSQEVGMVESVDALGQL
jgi:hypothetical protein